MRGVRAICPRLRSGRVAGLRQVLAILARSSSWSRLISAKDSVPQSIPCKKRQGTVRSRCWPQISAGQRTRGGAGYARDRVHPPESVAGRPSAWQPEAALEDALHAAQSLVG